MVFCSLGLKNSDFGSVYKKKLGYTDGLSSYNCYHNCYCTFLGLVNFYSEIPAQERPSVKITSHTQDQSVPTGNLTVSGISSDTASTNCKVYLDWNHIVPFQEAVPTGGANDYSTWRFTYNQSYRNIVNDENELTATISCKDSSGATTQSSFDTITVVGETTASGGTIDSSPLVPSPMVEVEPEPEPEEAIPTPTPTWPPGLSSSNS